MARGGGFHRKWVLPFSSNNEWSEVETFSTGFHRKWVLPFSSNSTVKKEYMVRGGDFQQTRVDQSFSSNSILKKE